MLGQQAKETSSILLYLEMTYYASGLEILLLIISFM